MQSETLITLHEYLVSLPATHSMVYCDLITMSHLFQHFAEQLLQ